MSKNFWTILLASALFAAVAMWSSPGFPATRSDETPAPATQELRALADLDALLSQVLRGQERHLDSSCEFATVRQRLLIVRDEAMGAIRRIGGLWREGRLRDGGLALSEVLVYDFAAVLDEARRDTALADTLAMLQQETRRGSGDARALLRRMIEIHPAPPACLTRALDEEEGSENYALGVLERVIFTDYATGRPW